MRIHAFQVLIWLATAFFFISISYSFVCPLQHSRVLQHDVAHVIYCCFIRIITLAIIRRLNSPTCFNRYDSNSDSYFIVFVFISSLFSIVLILLKILQWFKMVASVCVFVLVVFLSFFKTFAYSSSACYKISGYMLRRQCSLTNVLNEHWATLWPSTMNLIESTKTAFKSSIACSYFKMKREGDRNMPCNLPLSNELCYSHLSHSLLAHALHLWMQQ